MTKLSKETQKNNQMLKWHIVWGEIYFDSKIIRLTILSMKNGRICTIYIYIYIYNYILRGQKAGRSQSSGQNTPKKRCEIDFTPKYATLLIYSICIYIYIYI